MSQPFKLIEEKFSEVYKERQWTYLCSFSLILNRRKINKITITDHTWKKKGRENITKELILDIFKKKLNRLTIKQANYSGNRKPFIEEKMPYQGKKYKIVFCFSETIIFSL